MLKLRISYADGRIEDREFAPGKYLVGRELGDIVLADENGSGGFFRDSRAIEW